MKTRALLLTVVTATALVVGLAPAPARAAGTPILGPATISARNGADWARAKGGTAEFAGLASLFWAWAPARGGVRPEVAYAQSSYETGYGRFGGTIDATYHNACGLKTAVGGGDKDPAAHQRFATWEQGVIACLDHLALYAGAPGYPRRDTPDPRHFSFLLGTATTVEALGERWAPNSDYGTELIASLTSMLRGPEPEWSAATVDTPAMARGGHAAAVGLGQVHVFGAPASGGGVRHAWLGVVDYGWASEVLDPGGTIAGGTVGAADAFGQVHAFARPASGAGLRHLWYDPAVGRWLAETVDRNSPLAVSDVTVFTAWNQLHVFARQANGGGLRHVWYDVAAGVWLAETLDAGGYPAGSTGVTGGLWYEQVHVFGAAPGGGLRHTWWDPVAGRWLAETLDQGGTFGADPTAWTLGAQLHTYVPVASGDGVRHVWWDPAGARWNAETLDRGGSLADGAVAVNAYGQHHLFTRRAAGSGLRHLFWDGRRWTAETLDSAGAAGTGLSVVIRGIDLEIAGNAASGAGFRSTAYRWSY